MTDDKRQFTVVKRYYLNDGITEYNYYVEEITGEDNLKGFVGTYEECCNYKKQCQEKDDQEDPFWSYYVKGW